MRPELVSARLGELRRRYVVPFEVRVARSLAELRALCELTRVLQRGH